MEIIFNRITDLLESNKIAYSIKEHSPTLTSEDSARERKDDLSIGAKALVIKAGTQFILVVISASLKLNSKKLKKSIKSKSIRFATADELKEMTNLVPGSVPPFGEPVLPFPLYIDLSIQNLENIAFNAGFLTKSIKMSASDYVNISQGTLIEVTEEI